MPTYNFKNIETGEEWETFVSISDRDLIMTDPNIMQIHNSAPTITHNSTGAKPDSGFRDVLKRIKSKHLRSNINTF